MMLATAILVIVHPGFALKGAESEFPRFTRKERKAMKKERKAMKKEKKAEKVEMKRIRKEDKARDKEERKLRNAAPTSNGGQYGFVDLELSASGQGLLNRP
jgi:Sec-independent protein translocase protein TatA